MKLNLAVIYDELEGFETQLQETAMMQRELEGVRLLRPDSRIAACFAYVVDADTLSEYERLHADGTVSDLPQFSSMIYVGHESCKGPESIGNLPVVDSSAHEILFVDTACPRVIVLEAVQAIFERFDRWERDVLTSIARARSFQTTLDLCVRVLHNPVALFDSSLSLLLTAGDIPTDVRGSIWEDVLSLGYTPSERLSQVERKADEAHWEQSTEPYLFHPNAYPAESELVAVLRSRNTQVGALGSVDICAPFTRGQMSLYGAVRDFVELAIDAQGQASAMAEGMMPVMRGIISGELNVRNDAVNRALSELRWDEHEWYLACYLVRDEGEGLTEHAREIVMKRVSQMIRPSFILEYAQGVIVVFREIDEHRLEKRTDGIVDALIGLDLTCGVSMPMHDFMSLHLAAEQARLAARFADGSGQSHISRFNDVYLRCVIGTLDDELPLGAFCDPSIYAMASADDTGTERADTLLTYLSCGKNMSETARKLNVHRNTLVYRLARIEEDLGCDLEDLDINRTLLFLLSCVIAQDAARR